MHVSAVQLLNGVPFFARIHGDWQLGRAFRVASLDGKEAFNTPPLHSEKNEQGDLACILAVTKEHLKDLQDANKWDSIKV